MTARVIFKRQALLYALATVFPFASGGRDGYRHRATHRLCHLANAGL